MKSSKSRLLPRRAFLKAGGALIVGFHLAGFTSGSARAADSIERGATPGPPDPKQIDTWIAIHADNTASIYIGFAELGQGASTALLQIAAEELDMDLNQLSSVRLDTNITPNQGGTYSSASVQRGGPQIRAAAAEARLALLGIAAKRLGVPADQLQAARGVVSVIGRPQSSFTYGELVQGKQFNITFTGTAPVKSAADYRIVGKGVPRLDVPAKVSGKHLYMQHSRLPGMLHGRVVRPRGQQAFAAGAKPLSVDEKSIANIPGARVVRKGDFIGVVAEREWDAVRAARQLKVSWQTPPELWDGKPDLHDAMRSAQTQDRVVLERGDVAAAIAGAAHVVSQSFRGPYQSHATFAPNCALADVRPGSALIQCSTNDAYGTRNVVSRVLGMRPEQVRVQYYEGSGTYGHSCFDDAAQAAAVLSQATGKPVRVQFMRWDEHGWDTYGQAHYGEVRVAADAGGKLTAYEYHGWQHNWSAVDTTEQLALGTPPAESNGTVAQQVSPFNLGAAYTVANLKLVNHRVPGGAYLRSSYLRSPLDLSFSFASEQAIDQLAYLLGMDPYEFRRNNIRDERWQGVLDAVAKAANWQPRRAAQNKPGSKIVAGRGIGLGTHLTSYGAAVADIEVNRETGHVTAKHMYGAIDAGLAVNPAFIENQISGQMVQTVSRMLKEEVTFSKTNVTSLDWNSYPILRFEECPEVTPVVVQRMNEKSTGAGEESMAAAAAAIANAFFDATGVRMREYPFTPKRVLDALRGRA
jgi:nicotinate dehydrogenase subunit B